MKTILIALALLAGAPAARAMSDDRALDETVALTGRFVATIDQARDCDVMGDRLDALVKDSAALLEELDAATARRSEAEEKTFIDRYLERAAPAIRKLGTPKNRKKLRTCMGNPKVRRAITTIP